MLINKLLPICTCLLSSCISMEINSNINNALNQVNCTTVQLQKNFETSLNNSKNYLNNLQNTKLDDESIDTLKENTINTYKNLWDLQLATNNYREVSSNEIQFKNYLEHVNIFLLKNNNNFDDDKVMDVIYKYIVDDEIKISNYRNSYFHLKYFYLHHLNISNIFSLKLTLNNLITNEKDKLDINDIENMEWFSKHINFRMNNYQYECDVAIPRKKNNTQENKLFNLIKRNIKITKSCLKELKEEYTYNNLISDLAALEYNDTKINTNYLEYENTLYYDHKVFINILQKIKNIKYPPAPIEQYSSNENTIKESKIKDQNKKANDKLTFKECLRVYKPLAFAINDCMKCIPKSQYSADQFMFWYNLTNNIIKQKATTETKNMLDTFHTINDKDFADSKHVLYTALHMIQNIPVLKGVYDKLDNVLHDTYSAFPKDKNDIEDIYQAISEIIDVTIQEIPLNKIETKEYEKINKEEYFTLFKKLRNIFNTVAKYNTDDLIENIKNDLNDTTKVVEYIYNLINNDNLQNENNLLDVSEIEAKSYIKYNTDVLNKDDINNNLQIKQNPWYLQEIGAKLYVKYKTSVLNKDEILLYKACLLALYCQKLVYDVHFKNFKKIKADIYKHVYDLCYEYLKNIHKQFINNLQQYFQEQ